METPTKPALPLLWQEVYVPSLGKHLLAVTDGNGQPLDEVEIGWLRDAAAAHGPALKALREVTHELAALVKGEKCEHDANICWCGVQRMLNDARDAIAAMEQAPEPEP